MLPQKFTDRMKQMLGDEYEAFIESFSQEKYQALRLNPQKVRADFAETGGFHLSPVPWEPEGFIYAASDQPGRHPYHEAGVYYIQEPSAMAPVHYLDPQPGEKVLDLCAAPGGKSTQIAGRMNGEGILVSNEINAARAKILSLNMERLGVRNAMVTNETPEKLAGLFEAWFDRILVDAPCSGEGMFRKNEAACEEWSPENVEMCAERQDGILDCAAQMLAPGGRIVYSTCTFAPAEDEGSVSRFLQRHDDFHLLPAEKYDGMEDGHPEWAEGAPDEIRNTVRLWPHRIKGEGHFLAVLQRDGDSAASRYGSYCPNGLQKGIREKECRPWLEFKNAGLSDRLISEPLFAEGVFFLFGDQLYLAPAGMPSTDHLRVLRPGLHLGTLKKDRFEPSHALALTLTAEDVQHTLDLPSDSPEITAFLNGQTLKGTDCPGWHLITTDGYSIGWGKNAGKIMKNHYPKGLRITF